MIELLFADCNCQSLTKKFPLRCQKFPHSSQISSQISVGFANFVDMGIYGSYLVHSISCAGMPTSSWHVHIAVVGYKQNILHDHARMLHL